MTITKAAAWTTIPRTSPGIGSPKTMMPPAMQEMFAAVPVMAMTETASPSWSDRAEAKKAAAEPRAATSEPGADEAEHAVGADDAGQRLDGDVADAEEDARGGGEHDAVVLGGGAGAGAEDEQAAQAEQDGLEGDHGREREGRVRRVGLRAS